MDPDAGLPVARAHPQVVCRDGTHLRNLQQRRYSVAQAVHSTNCCEGVPAGNQVLTLQLLAAARCEIHAEMGQPLIPWAWDAHLLSARGGREAGDWVFVGRGERRAEPL